MWGKICAQAAFMSEKYAITDLLTGIARQAEMVCPYAVVVTENTIVIIIKR